MGRSNKEMVGSGRNISEFVSSVHNGNIKSDSKTNNNHNNKNKVMTIFTGGLYTQLPN